MIMFANHNRVVTSMPATNKFRCETGFVKFNSEVDGT